MELSINIGWFECQHPSKDYGIDFFTVPGILKRAGFAAAEYFPSMGHFSANPTLINRTMRSAGIRFYSGHLPMVGDQLSFDPVIYKERLSYLKDWIEYYAKLGIRVAVVHPDEDPFPLAQHPARMELCVKWAHVLAKHAAKFGMKIAVETTWMRGSLFAYHKNIQYFKDNITAPNLGFCFDTGHAYGADTPDARRNIDKNFWTTWDLMKDRIFTFHLHNTYANSDYHNPFHMGGIDFKRFLGAVKQMNYKFPLTLELRPTKCLGVGERTDIKDWAPAVNNGNVEKSLRAAAHMFHKYYDLA